MFTLIIKSIYILASEVDFHEFYQFLSRGISSGAVSASAPYNALYFYQAVIPTESSIAEFLKIFHSYSHLPFFRIHKVRLLTIITRCP